MTYEVTLSPAAVRQLRRFDPPVRRRLQAVIELLADNPCPPAAKQLVGGAGEWSVGTGDYRVIYEIHDAVLVVLVLRRAIAAGSIADAARPHDLTRTADL